MAEKTRDQSLIQDILDTDYAMKNEKSYYETVFQDIIDNVLTNQPSVNFDNNPGKDRSTTMFDGTPRSALNVFVNGIYGLMVSPHFPWFRLEMDDQDLNEIYEVKLWLQETEKRLYSAFRRSNFYSEVKSLLRDGGSIGTACVYPEEDLSTGITYYTSIPIREFRIAVNKNGVVDRLHREFDLTARQLKDKFGEDNLTAEMKKALNSDNASERLQKFRILHAVFPRTDLMPGIQVSKNKPWASIYVNIGGRSMSNGDIRLGTDYYNEAKIIKESGFDEFPYIIWRFDKETSEIYGRSPAWHILSEIRGAHVLEKDLIKAAELSVNGPMNVHVSQKDSFQRIPGGRSYFKDPKEKAEAIDLRINYPATLEHQDRKRQIIREAWFVDFFLLIASRETTMTATEVIELQGEKIAILAPIITSLSQESLSTIIQRQFNIEAAAGRLTEPPRILAGRNYNISFIGPLAQAQQRAFETQGIQKSFEVIRPIFEVRPETLDNFDLDGISRDGAASSGLPVKYIKPMDDVNAIRDARVAQAQRDEELEASDIKSKNLKNIALADKAVGGKLSKQLEGAA